MAKYRAKVALSATVILFGVVPASATIDNTVTATGTPLNGIPDSVTATATESVDVVDAAPALVIVKTPDLNDEVNADGFAEVGETITYTYEVTNTGNVTLTNISIEDIHEGVLLLPSPATEAITTPGPNATSDIGTPDDGVIDVLDVGAIARFSVTLPVTQEEVDNQ